MSILIKGMGMPTSCHECRLYEGDIYYCSAADKIIDISDSSEGRCQFCPLIPIPKHGRLIDADALEYEEAYLNGHYELGDVEIVTREDIESAPTIIPAEEVE